MPTDDAARGLFDKPYRTMIRDVAPTTPARYAPKSVEGDPIPVSAVLVHDGHDLLAARVRWRRTDGDDGARRRWTVVQMAVDSSGFARAEIAPAEPGRYQFEIQAWPDRFSSWRRDLRLRAEAGEDLGVEFAVGAELIEQVADQAGSADRRRLTDTAQELRSVACSDRVRLATALDDAVAAAMAGLVDPAELSTSDRHPLRVDRELAAAGAWYEFFPRSEGGFVRGASSWERLEAISAAGFDVLYLPPIHPIGVQHRKGRDNTLVAGPDDVGSPWAIGGPEGGHTSVHPDLGTLADVERFISRAGELGVEVALDYALQCSPDHPWVSEHPEWFSHRPDGSIRYAENPPKKYQDIYPINFWPESDSDREALWRACGDVIEFWAERGVSVFRVDNPHTKPLAFWAWLIKDVQDRHPDLVFLAEAFTDPTMMHSLGEVGFSQSYTYFTWRRTKWELIDYGNELAHAPSAGWFRPNLWPNTPDILVEPLVDASPAVFASRAVLAATLAPSWGVYSGFEHGENIQAKGREEYADSEKYELKPRDHDEAAPLWRLFTELNRARRSHPAFDRMNSLRFHETGSDDVIAYSHDRVVEGDHDRVLVVVVLTPDQEVETSVTVDLGALGMNPDAGFGVLDELTGEQWDWRPGPNYVRLGPERVAHLFSLT